jgi:hypothetical protein
MPTTITFVNQQDEITGYGEIEDEFHFFPDQFENKGSQTIIPTFFPVPISRNELREYLDTNQCQNQEV